MPTKKQAFSAYQRTGIYRQKTQWQTVLYRPAKVPDVDGCITTAPTLAEAIALITDALNLCLVGLEDEEITPNEPTPQSEIPHLPTDILTIIQADTIKYRSMTDTKAVRKNVSLPAWMSKLADKRGINCSKVLQEALTAKLL